MVGRHGQGVKLLFFGVNPDADADADADVGAVSLSL